MLALDVVLASLLVTACYVAWLAYKEWKRSEATLSLRQRQFNEMAEQHREMLTLCGEEVEKREKLQVEHQQQCETLRAIVELRDKSICDVRATLEKRDAELKNMSESMRVERIRAEAKIEGLEKQLRQEQEATKGLRSRLSAADNFSREWKETASKRWDELQQLATELDAAKTLLAGVKIGVGEILVLQPTDDSEDAYQYLQESMQCIEEDVRKVVVVRHANAWRAVPIPRATATKVEEAAHDSLGDVLAGKPRTFLGGEVRELAEENQRLRVQLDECRSKREAITFERDAYARDFAKLQLDHANTVALLESVQRELGDFQTLFDVLTCFEVNGSCSGMQSTGEWNQINIGLSSRLIHPAHTGDGRSAPAATVANRDTSKNGPTSEQLQALADLLLAGLQRKYPLLATWGPKEEVSKDNPHEVYSLDEINRLLKDRGLGRKPVDIPKQLNGVIGGGV